MQKYTVKDPCGKQIKVHAHNKLEAKLKAAYFLHDDTPKQEDAERCYRIVSVS